jgi:hypothetical protein
MGIASRTPVSNRDPSLGAVSSSFWAVMPTSSSRQTL